MDYQNEGLNQLRNSLRATGVLSPDYSSLLMSMAFSATAEAYREGTKKPSDVVVYRVETANPDGTWNIRRFFAENDLDEATRLADAIKDAEGIVGVVTGMSIQYLCEFTNDQIIRIEQERSHAS